MGKDLFLVTARVKECVVEDGHVVKSPLVIDSRGDTSDTGVVPGLPVFHKMSRVRGIADRIQKNVALAYQLFTGVGASQNKGSPRGMRGFDVIGKGEGSERMVDRPGGVADFGTSNAGHLCPL